MRRWRVGGRRQGETGGSTGPGTAGGAGRRGREGQGHSAGGNEEDASVRDCWGHWKIGKAQTARCACNCWIRIMLPVAWACRVTRSNNEVGHDLASCLRKVTSRRYLLHACNGTCSSKAVGPYPSTAISYAMLAQPACLTFFLQNAHTPPAF